MAAELQERRQPVPRGPPQRLAVLESPVLMMTGQVRGAPLGVGEVGVPSTRAGPCSASDPQAPLTRPPCCSKWSPRHPQA